VPGDDWTGVVDGVERLKALMARCLHADPSRRPSMDDFLAELDAIRSPSLVSDGGYGGVPDGGYGTVIGSGAGGAPMTSPPRPAGTPALVPAPAVAAATPASTAAAGSASTRPGAATQPADVVDMSEALAAMDALHIASDVADRVCDEMVLAAAEAGHVSGAQFLQIVIDEGVKSALAMRLREKLRITSVVPPRKVRCDAAPCAAATTSVSCRVVGGGAACCRGACHSPSANAGGGECPCLCVFVGLSSVWIIMRCHSSLVVICYGVVWCQTAVSSAGIRLADSMKGEDSRAIETAGLMSMSNGVAVSRDGPTVLVADQRGSSHAIHEFRVADGSLVRVIGGPGEGPLRLHAPYQVWIAHVFVADYYNNRVQVLTPRLDFHAFAGVGQLHTPTGVCADDAVVVVSEWGAHRISVFNRGDGALLRRFGARGSGEAA
jgi:hypothetical protein